MAVWKSLIFWIIIILCSSACGGECPMARQLEDSQNQLDAARQALMALQEYQEERKLVHIVFIKLRQDLTVAQKEEFKNKMLSLADLPMLRSLRVGSPAATGDPRLNSDYDLVLHTTFASPEDLAAYQQDERHLEARASTQEFMAGPPVVFDYWME